MSLYPLYDVTIQAAPKDYHKLPLAINSLRWLCPQPCGIYIISPDGYMPSGTDYDRTLIAVTDDEVMPGCDRSKLKYHPNWCFQSLMKFVQDVTANVWFLDTDADNFFVKPLSLFTEQGKGRFFMSPQHSGYHPPYWRFSRKMFGLERVAPDRVIMDFMLYNKRLAHKIFADYGSLEALFEKYCEVVNRECLLSDQELYGNWCLKYHPAAYELVAGVPVRLYGRYYPHQWTVEDIQAILNDPQKVGDAIAVTCHTWDGTWWEAHNP